MRTGRSFQQVLLTSAVALLRQVVADTGDDLAAARDVLEAAASRIGGFDLEGYRQVLDIDARLSAGQADGWAEKLLDLIEDSGVPRRLALAALAQPEVTDTRRRTTGAYYTDFRLARYLARRMVQLPATPFTPAGTVIDPAAGTGVLLVALAEQVGRDDPGALRDLVAHGLCAVDRDPECRRATVATLASLTADLGAIAALATRIKTADSLVADQELWNELSTGGRFDAVIGNPPWERLRVTRHETSLAGGSRRNYGADYEPEPPADRAAYSGEAGRVRRYVDELVSRYTLLGDRRIDLYQAFLALGWDLVGTSGSIGMLLPAGLIRAQGTWLLRKHLLTNSADVDVTVFHNRSHFFGIDSRFKFLAVCAQVSGRRDSGATIRLSHSEGNDQGVPEPMPVLIKFADLAVRRGLTVPEVTSEREWQLFQHMTAQGSRPSDPDSPWAMRITREIDMTTARPLFSRTRSAADIPVIEGRMIHQYRSRAKTYVSGAGRAAIWRPLALGEAGSSQPQFFLDPRRLPDVVQRGISRPRVGFCDIVGQTNERTVQAALIGSDRICGNKVPTIEFLTPVPGERRQREMLFLAAANSLVVDWFVRRVVTTSLNFFILLDLPLPVLDLNSVIGRRLVDLAQRLVAAEAAQNCSARCVSLYRGEIDIAITDAYGIDVTDLPVILADFPLLDRGQPPLPGETRSTVTADLLAGMSGDRSAWARYETAADFGALAYVPEEFARFTTSS